MRKNLFIVLLLLFCAFDSFAQVAGLGFNFQALIRNKKGAPVVSMPVSLKFSLYAGTAAAPDYEETVSTVTDSFGVCAAIIGSGKTTGSSRLSSFSQIDFSSDIYQYQVYFNDNGTYVPVGSRQAFASVPYAKVAGNAVAVPAGTIMAFAGDTSKIPSGWLLCDGRQLDISGKYQGLYNVIQFNWGQGANSTTFYLPDFRGRFLRGVDMGTGSDPDAASRTAANTGGNAGNKVGSVQDDQFKSHNHYLTGSYLNCGGPPPAYLIINNTPSPVYSQSSSYTGGNETRPKNAYVNYIIKY